MFIAHFIFSLIFVWAVVPLTNVVFHTHFVLDFTQMCALSAILAFIITFIRYAFDK